MSAVQFSLDNLTVIIDNNGMQSDGASRGIMDVSGRYARVLATFGCDTIEADGHNLEELLAVLENPKKDGSPKAVVAHTVKGKGISFMEGNNDWHHNRLTEKQYLEAMKELEAAEAWK